MSFTGDLEHLPIVDVIQLLNSTRKSGILSVIGKRGESQLVFKDGFMVSASHLNNSVRIGQILIGMGLISNDQLDQALAKQQSDGPGRRPLVITLIEMGLVRGEDAHRGLQKLIETTLVEILTWKSGKFTLHPLSGDIVCNFRYYPEKMNHEVNLNTQNILMEALRLYDEKVRDGLIGDEDEQADGFDEAFGELLSEDLLGLDEMDKISAELPKAFTGLSPDDPIVRGRRVIAELAPHLPPADQEKIADFLANRDGESMAGKDEAERELVLLSSDRLLAHALETLCADSGITVTTIQSRAEAEESMARAMGAGRRPCLAVDANITAEGGGSREETVCAIFKGKFPSIPIIQLAHPEDTPLTLRAYRSGARAVIPRPRMDGSSAAFADEFISLAEILPAYILQC